MGTELKDKIENVENQEDDGGTMRKHQDCFVGAARKLALQCGKWFMRVERFIPTTA